MAAEYKKFCRAASRIKGNHIYQSRPEMNTVFDSEIEPNNNELIHAILVYKEMHKGIPFLEKVTKLSGSLKDKAIRIKCYIIGESMEAREGMWN